MRTKRLISTISYNSDAFIVEALRRLVAAGLVDWAHWVRHEPEEDEKKSHIHLVLSPARAIDTTALSAAFEEVDLAAPGKAPLGVIPWRFCASLDDWLLYAIHDPDYLLSKGQTRAHHYDRNAVRSTSTELLVEQWGEVNLARFGLGQQLADMAARRIPWERVICSGLIKPAQWTFWREVYFSLLGQVQAPVRRSPTHTPKRLQNRTLKGLLT